MEPNDQVKVLDKLTELFISKGRKLEDVTAKVWIAHLCGYGFGVEETVKGIDKMIYANDDFPTVSKILNFIAEVREFTDLMARTEKTLLDSEKHLKLEDKS